VDQSGPTINSAELNWLDQKARESVSVLDFGADPTGVADSTAAFQAAINSFASSGGTLYIPSSSFSGYKISAPLVIPSLNYYLRITGAGKSSILTKTSSFDLFTWSNPGTGVMAGPFTQIDNLQINANGISGANNAINTQYCSSLILKNLSFLNLETAGCGILVEGNGTTYSHEIYISGIYISTSTGLAGVYFGSTSSDSQLDGFLMQGNESGNVSSGCSYGVYVSDNAGNLQLKNIHSYNALVNNLYMGATPSGTTWQVEDSYIDNATQNSALLSSTKNATFTNVTFRYPPASYSCLALSNSNNNKFIGCTFDGATTGGFSAVNENGASDNNTFIGCIESGTFTSSPSLILPGPSSTFSSLGQSQSASIFYPSLAAGQTIYGGSGYSGTDSFQAKFISLYSGFVKKLYIGSQNAVSSGAITATVLVNGVAPSGTISASLNSSSPYLTLGLNGVGVPITAGDSISVSIASATGTPTTSIIAGLSLVF
jgi:hypothetical protein